MEYKCPELSGWQENWPYRSQTIQIFQKLSGQSKNCADNLWIWPFLHSFSLFHAHLLTHTNLSSFCRFGPKEIKKWFTRFCVKSFYYPEFFVFLTWVPKAQMAKSRPSWNGPCHWCNNILNISIWFETDNQTNKVLCCLHSQMSSISKLECLIGYWLDMNGFLV